MTGSLETQTAVLAAVFGASVLTSGILLNAAAAPDARTIRELTVLSRVLEARLAAMRAAMAGAVGKGEAS